MARRRQLGRRLRLARRAPRVRRRRRVEVEAAVVRDGGVRQLPQQCLQAVVEVLDLRGGRGHQRGAVLLGLALRRDDVVQQPGVGLLEQVHAREVHGARADSELLLLPIHGIPRHEEERHPALHLLALLGRRVVQQRVPPLFDQMVDRQQLVRLGDGRPQAALHAAALPSLRAVLALVDRQQIEGLVHELVQQLHLAGVYGRGALDEQRRLGEVQLARVVIGIGHDQLRNLVDVLFQLLRDLDLPDL
mmetsp:Transcript_98095/g.299936  ORF Transcript_98095/g.299936 Transcript_98095/m.299936 type:complete len:247 (+) Transcript_98095:393-1133(+)